VRGGSTQPGKRGSGDRSLHVDSALPFWSNWGGVGELFWSSAEGINSSPLEKEAALAAAAEGTLWKGYEEGSQDKEQRQQQRCGRRSCICQSFPCGKYLAGRIY